MLFSFSVQILQSYWKAYYIQKPHSDHIYLMFGVLDSWYCDHVGPVLPPGGHVAVAHIRILPYPRHVELSLLLVVHQLHRQRKSSSMVGRRSLQRSTFL